MHVHAYGEDDEVVLIGGAVGQEHVGDDSDAVHGLDEKGVASGRDGDVGAGAAEDVDADRRLDRLRAGDDRQQHLFVAQRR